jgi:uncharacterized protein YxeA
MVYQNFTDISVFENLQNEAHQSMGFSSLSVFNATFMVEDKKKAEENKQKAEKWKQSFMDDEQFLIKTKDEYQKKKEKFEKLEKAGQVERQAYIKAGNELGVLRVRRVTCRRNLIHGVKKLKDIGIIAISMELKEDD